MKVVDANVLLYAVDANSRHHAVARSWLTHALSGGETVGFPWVSLLALVRISTNTRVYPSPLTAVEAMDLVDTWLAAPSAVTVEPGVRHGAVLRAMLQESGTAGNLTTDAHLAALASEYRAEVVTFDRDLQRFGIPVVVPTSAHSN